MARPKSPSKRLNATGKRTVKQGGKVEGKNS